MQFKLLVFDFDGTIADTLSDSLEIVNQLAVEFGFNQLHDEDLARAKDMTLAQLIRFLRIPKRKVPILLARGRKMLRSRIETTPLCAGMGETLQRLQEEGWPMGVLTSNSRENVEAFCKAHQLNPFYFISSVSRLSGKHKYIRSILRTFSFRSDQILYIGDEARDVKAAKKVRVPMAACTWGYNSEAALKLYKPEFLVNEPAELLEVLQADGLEAPV